MFWNRKKKNDCLIITKKGKTVAIVKKDSFKYCFFNLKNKTFKVNVAIKENNFIYISVENMEEAFNIIEDIKRQMKDFKE